MSNKRSSIPKRTREQVLREFGHKCAICGQREPQLHHIDEDNRNNDLANLIPLCPNCHLSDLHTPNANIDSGRLSLFRQFREPAILEPQFRPLFKRLQFLDKIEDDSDVDYLQRCTEELISFVANLEMGEHYSKQISGLIRKPKYVRTMLVGDPASQARWQESRIREAHEYRKTLRKNRDATVALVVELLRFQSWTSSK